MTVQTKSNKNILIVIASMLIGMSLLVVTSVPLYKMFCKVTGYGGTTQTKAIIPTQALARTFEVRFNTDIDPKLPWEFNSDQPNVTVNVGEQKLVSFTATNKSARTIVGTSTFNVTPHSVGQYFNKVQCFCFKQQKLSPGETAHFPVSFYIDPRIMNDKEIQGLQTITLSYTFFEYKE